MSCEVQFEEIASKIDRLKTSIVEKIQRIDVIEKEVEISEDSDRLINGERSQLQMEILFFDKMISKLRYDLAVMREQASRGSATRENIQTLIKQAEARVETNSVFYERACFEVERLCTGIELFCSEIDGRSRADLEIDLMLAEELFSYR
jgi:chromosome segregation ATPase